MCLDRSKTFRLKKFECKFKYLHCIDSRLVLLIEYLFEKEDDHSVCFS